MWTACGFPEIKFIFCDKQTMDIAMNILATRFNWKQIICLQCCDRVQQSFISLLASEVNELYIFLKNPDSIRTNSRLQVSLLFRTLKHTIFGLKPTLLLVIDFFDINLIPTIFSSIQHELRCNLHYPILFIYKFALWPKLKK